MNGIEVTTEILKSKTLNGKNKGDRLIIVGLTGYLTEEIVGRCKEAGMKEVMVKPCSRSTITQLLIRFNIDFLSIVFT